MPNKKEDKIVVILQPGYLPWLGFFDQMNRCDYFIVFDTAQYTKGSWRNRNRIRTTRDWEWLTVPIYYNFTQQRIKDIEIDNHQKWAKKHWNLIRENYQKAPYFNNYAPFFEKLYKKEWQYLIDLDLEIIYYIANILGIPTKKIIKASSLNLVEAKEVNQKNIDYIKAVNGNIFLEADLGKEYFNQETFNQAGIKIVFHNYQHPTYRQLQQTFIPYLSIIDLLFNEGPKSLKILSNQHKD